MSLKDSRETREQMRKESLMYETILAGEISFGRIQRKHQKEILQEILKDSRDVGNDINDAINTQVKFIEDRKEMIERIRNL